MTPPATPGAQGGEGLVSEETARAPIVDGALALKPRDAAWLAGLGQLAAHFICGISPPLDPFLPCDRRRLHQGLHSWDIAATARAESLAAVAPDIAAAARAIPPAANATEEWRRQQHAVQAVLTERGTVPERQVRETAIGILHAVRPLIAAEAVREALAPLLDGAEQRREGPATVDDPEEIARRMGVLDKVEARVRRECAEELDAWATDIARGNIYDDPALISIVDGARFYVARWSGSGCTPINNDEEH